MTMHRDLFYKFIPFNGNTTRPIVFIHGYLESHTMWYQLPLSELERPILLVDVPGFGKSQLTDDQEPSIHYFALQIRKLLQELAVEEYDIVGHSMGGYIGLELLQLCHPSNRLVLLNSNFWEDTEEKKKDRVRVADVLLKAKNLFISEAIRNLFTHPETHEKEMRALISEAQQGIAEWYAYASLAMRSRKNFTPFVKENSHRIAILQGENDPLIPSIQMEQKCLDWKSIFIIKDSGHMSVFEQPKQTLFALKMGLEGEE